MIQKRFYRLFVACLLLATTLSAVELKWEKDLQSAFDRAVASQKPLMVMVESRSCRWCKKMKHRTLEEKKISVRLQNFVLVEVDRDTVSSPSVPYAKYVPTIYFMTPEKKILETVTGYFDVSDFSSWIDDAEKKLTSVE